MGSKQKEKVRCREDYNGCFGCSLWIRTGIGKKCPSCEEKERKKKEREEMRKKMLCILIISIAMGATSCTAIRQNTEKVKNVNEFVECVTPCVEELLLKLKEVEENVNVTE